MLGRCWVPLMVAAFAPCCAPGDSEETPADARGEAEADVGGPDAPADDAREEVDREPADLGEFWGDGMCGGEEISLTLLPTHLVFVVDRSSSMLNPADPAYTPTTEELGSCAETSSDPATGIGFVTRWDDVKAAVNGVASARASEISFGLTLFPGPGSLGGAGSPAALFCTGPVPAPRTVVPPGPDTVDELAAALDDPAANPVCNGGFTPTNDALAAARDALLGAPADGPGVLVLATDGAPNCNNALGSGCTCTTGAPFCDGTLGRIGCLDDDRVIATLGEILAAGIRTYVVGIPGTEGYVPVLDAMAVAGGTARDVTPRYYGVESRDELLSVLGTIAAGEISCVFELGHTPLDTTNINVLVDDDPLRRDDAENGFTYDATTNTVTLTGVACDDLRAGRTGNVKFIFGCPPLL